MVWVQQLESVVVCRTQQGKYFPQFITDQRNTLQEMMQLALKCDGL